MPVTIRGNSGSPSAAYSLKSWSLQSHDCFSFLWISPEASIVHKPYTYAVWQWRYSWSTVLRWHCIFHFSTTPPVHVSWIICQHWLIFECLQRNLTLWNLSGGLLVANRAHHKVLHESYVATFRPFRQCWAKRANLLFVTSL